MVANAAAARLAPAAFVAEASLRPLSAVVDAGADRGQAAVASAVGDVDEQRRMLLLELIGLHRQLRGMATNLNQAVAKLNALDEPVGELPAIAAYVRRVTTAVDQTVAEVRKRR